MAEQNDIRPMGHGHKGPDSFGRDKNEFFNYLKSELESWLELSSRRGFNIQDPEIFNEILALMAEDLITKNPRFKDFIIDFVYKNHKYE